MTEQEWLVCTDPQPMLAFLRGKISDRKLRLFAVACCRLLLQTVYVHPWYAHGIGIAERFADGRATQEELEAVRHYPSAEWCLHFARQYDPNKAVAAGQSKIIRTAVCACWNAMEVDDGVLIANCASLNAAWAATQPGTVMPDDNGISAGRLAAEQTVQCDILRHIVGNPFRPDPAPAAWPYSIMQLATALYDNQDCSFALHDALLEAGNAELAGHFDAEPWHPKGCWALDVILGKE